VNDAEGLSQDPTFRLIGSEKIWERGAALTSRLQSFETEMLAEEENFAGLARINRELIGRVEAVDSPQRVVRDIDSTEIPVYGQQEQRACNCHFESTCYHPLLLFNREGDCLAAKLRPGNVHSADDWPVVRYKGFPYQAASWKKARRVVAKVEFHLGELFPRVGFIVTNLETDSRGVVRFYNNRGRGEQWIKDWASYCTSIASIGCQRHRGCLCSISS
jgi:hypothetical protein